MFVAAADVLSEIHQRSAVNPEFLECFVEALGIHADLVLERGLFDGLGAEAREDAVQHLHVGVVALKEKVVGAAVRVGVHQDGAAGRTVAAGASDFLVIGLQAAGQGGVNHGSHIGLVDPHAEGDGGDHYLDASLQELLLDALAMYGIEPGVVGGTGEVVRKVGGHGCGLRARRRVDDRRAAGFFEEEFQGKRGALRGRYLHDFDGQIVAAEALNEVRGLQESQLQRRYRSARRAWRWRSGR